MAVMQHASPALSYERFVTEHDQVLRRYVAGKLRGLPNDVDDALQEGLVRIWRQYHDWPADLSPGQRLAYAYKLLSHASDDALRRRFGRDGKSARREDHVIDFRAIDEDSDDSPRAGIVGQVREHLAQMNRELDADDADADDEVLERRSAALHAALAALTPLQQQVFFAHHRGGCDRNGKEVAAELSISHQKARTEYMEARAIVGPLFAHALAPDLATEERDRILAYSSGEMTNWRDKARMKRHLAHCAKCRALLESERAVVSAGAHLLFPLPALLGLAKAAGATAATAGGVAVAGSALGEAGVGGGLLSGVGAKVAATAVAMAAIGGATVAITHTEDGAGGAATSSRRAVSLAATPAPVRTRPIAVVTPTPTPKAARRETKRRSSASAVALEFATAAPMARSARPRSTPAAAPPARFATTEPPAAREPPSDSFRDEFTP